MDPLNFLQSAVGVVGQGVQVYNQATGKTTTAPATGVPQPTPKTQPTPAPELPAWRKYLPWILGAAAAGLVLWFVVKSK